MDQRTPEWFAARAGRVTASNAGALLGLSPHTSEADGFRRLVRSMHGFDSEFVGNVATEYGTFHEDGALAEYEMETGNVVFTPAGVQVDRRPAALLCPDANSDVLHGARLVPLFPMVAAWDKVGAG